MSPFIRFFEKWGAQLGTGMAFGQLALMLYFWFNSLFIAGTVGVLFTALPLRVAGVRLTPKFWGFFALGCAVSVALNVGWFLATFKGFIWQ